MGEGGFREKGGYRQTDKKTDRDRETETERQKQRDRNRETETERQREQQIVEKGNIGNAVHAQLFKLLKGTYRHSENRPKIQTMPSEMLLLLLLLLL